MSARVVKGGIMSAWSSRHVTAILAISGALVAGAGNAVAPRINGDTVDVYRRIAHSTRYEAGEILVLAALILVTAAFVGLTRSLGGRESELALYGRLAAVIGGTIGIVQAGVELYGYRQSARSFADANSNNVVSAFWATNALDHVNAALFATWTVVLLGLAPILIGATQWRRAAPAPRLALAAILGGLICVVVGIGSLLKQDQSTFDIPFAVGSVIVTLWLLVTGVQMWRTPLTEHVDLTEQRKAPTEVQARTTA